MRMVAEKIYLLDLGWLGGDLGWFLPGAAGGALTNSNKSPKREWVEIPVTAALVQHKDGYVLFDTGIAPDAMQTHAKGLMDVFPIIKFSEENRIERQLMKVGIKPSDVSFVVISHLHLDHIGQALPFKDAKVPILVQKKELEYALYMLWQGKGGAYDLADLEPLKGANWVPIDDRTFQLLDGVELEFTGGHTPGHQVMHVSTRGGNNYTFTGDYLHIPQEYELEAKGWLLSDADEWHSYIRKLKVRERARKAKIVLSHDPGLWNKFPSAPKGLE
ncbi:N-acyl homoserine lactonase AttM [Sulfodiicoccus acidiphilus]|uniref:N-acyl homoserine lactonase AttM n=2 Tax=Sulfodiicoccus acidiphilus TaxID=1670455 RepID=A0A348B6K2_9CREN|nr:N-acyl homoserine lactonase AttM [Sulfodiicoccus acidiphilus]GGU03612.1 N-acyl homoserine lactonase AttM [Sulfodiicoccus acidiphilus]